MHGTLSILPLELHGVSYAVRGQRLIDGVDMTFAAGSRTVIMGPNGAGKSLTLRLCHGLIRPTAGQIVWTGQAAPNGRKPHALVFQRPVLLRRSALANLTHALSVAGVGHADRRRQAQDALVRFGLESIADRPARVMSGGEQQRLAMARAWALAPQVLFLDEPTASLDPAATRAIEGMIAAFHAAGVKIVMTTHDLGQARRLADEVIFLNHGRILEQTPAEEFWDTPRTAEAQAFIRGELLW